MLPVLSRSHWRPSRRITWLVVLIGLIACAIPTVWNSPLLADPPAGEPVLSSLPARLNALDVPDGGKLLFGVGDVTLTNVSELEVLLSNVEANAGQAEEQKAKAEKAFQDANAALAARNREGRLEKLEAQLAELLQEVKSLRGGDGAGAVHEYRIKTATTPRPVLSNVPGPAAPVAKTPPAARAAPLQATPLYGMLSKAAPATTATRPQVWAVRPADGAPTSTQVVLMRATYQLPQSKATALEAFLRDNVKTSVLEMKVDGDALVVTTTAEVEQGIGMIVALMQPVEKVRVRLDEKIRATETKEAPKK